MVRNYVRKTTRGYYSKHLLEEAIEEVKAEHLNPYKASKKYNIPLSTIMDHLKGRRGIKSKSFGRKIAIPVQDEKRLADGLLKMEKCGFNLTRKEVLELVGQYVKINKIKVPFKNGIPGEDWFLGFSRRNNLSLKKIQSVEITRKRSCNPFIVDEYFSLLYNTIKDLQLENEPSRIWNIGEIIICTDPTKTKICNTNELNISSKENITVLLSASASGNKVPPLIIFKGKSMRDHWRAQDQSGYPETTYAVTTNGWIQAAVFENYFEKSFLKTIGNQRPVLLIYDGSSTHISIKLMEMASQENITILKLPSNTSHVLQPLEIVFQSLKTTWDQVLVWWQREHFGAKLPKNEFSRLISEIWNDFNSNTIKNGFEKAGLYPFSRNVVPESMYTASLLKKWKDTETVKKKHKNSTRTTET